MHLPPSIASGHLVPRPMDEASREMRLTLDTTWLTFAFAALQKKLLPSSSTMGKSPFPRHCLTDIITSCLAILSADHEASLVPATPRWDKDKLHLQLHHAAILLPFLNINS